MDKKTPITQLIACAGGAFLLWQVRDSNTPTALLFDSTLFLYSTTQANQASLLANLDEYRQGWDLQSL